MHCSIVPPYLLRRIARLERDSLQPAAEAARRALLRTAGLNRTRQAKVRQLSAVLPAPSVLHPGPEPARGPEAWAELAPDRQINDAQHGERLPGKRVRSEGRPPVADPVVNEAYDGLGSTFELFARVYGRNSLDDAGEVLRATVHYGQDYDNAFWNGTRMVFGDGDGQILKGFTGSLSVIGHELTHGVVQYTANFAYQGQSGALNESMADVFAVLVEQYALRQTAAEASWLIGEGLFTDQVSGVALRSLKEPGTAYDDDVLGKDPQPGSMAGYVQTSDDNGGVHLNSGIPNRAFALLALRLGGYAWERAGLIWYDALTGPDVGAQTDFAGFVRATESAAVKRYGRDSEEYAALAAAWAAVGLMD
ncbi:M4 family metallopeptidase [Arthrobacter mobilis]|uniref:Neutral metalloproteinase n=1 Tax=Arthrobacter mobilis TaxID=2724944 RepID=A0A7X6HBM7_9MICC|nr:M4 family metallopeptidase [Arthrobacter mobilis]NKX54116.1 M4 family metallopeptidase [Arthrobacter mobilis]